MGFIAVANHLYKVKDEDQTDLQKQVIGGQIHVNISLKSCMQLSILMKYGWSAEKGDFCKLNVLQGFILEVCSVN